MNEWRFCYVSDLWDASVSISLSIISFRGGVRGGGGGGGGEGGSKFNRRKTHRHRQWLSREKRKRGREGAIESAFLQKSSGILFYHSLCFVQFYKFLSSAWHTQTMLDCQSLSVIDDWSTHTNPEETTTTSTSANRSKSSSILDTATGERERDRQKEIRWRGGMADQMFETIKK